MKKILVPLVKTAIQTLQQQQQLPDDLAVDIHFERTRDQQFGDFACNIAMLLAKQVQRKPRELAELLVANMPSSSIIKTVTVAGPGFINFFLTDVAWHGIVPDILKAEANYGRSTLGNNARVHMEFVSANPTGPLHVGHGRSAAYGAALADLLETVGFEVHREYYVNDAGRQMDILATSVWLRYLTLCGEALIFPTNAYRGDYIIDMAKQLLAEHGEKFKRKTEHVFHDVPADEGTAGGDKDAHIDGLILRAKTLLNAEDYRIIFDRAVNTILKDIREDLSEFGVHYQQWFSERSLMDEGAIDRAITRLQQSNHLYEHEGALWFRSTNFGDDKDRVVKRVNGQPTYFASDIAYHLNKYERGFQRMIDVLGADHHGYAPRIKAVLQALNIDPAILSAPLVQFAILYRGGERVQMSTRSGSFVTLRELREEVGNDAARFFYVSRKCEQHMDFDLDLAKSQSSENPVYYIQYAHARICSVMRQLTEKKWQWTLSTGLEALNRLLEPHERAILATLSRYAETVENAALSQEPHLVAHYLRDLANDFHAYYNASPFLVEDAALRDAKLCLINATRQVLKNGLRLLGVSAPESM